jgi:hypothetical protein
MAHSALVLIDGPYGMQKYPGDDIRTPQSERLYRGVIARAERESNHVVIFGLFESLAWIYEHCIPSPFGLKLRRDVVWHKPDWTGGAASSFAPRHELFLHLAHPEAQFFADAIRVPYGERASKGVNKKARRTGGWQPNPLGARCSDVLTVTSDRLAEKVEGRTQANKHPCVKPKALLTTIVRACAEFGGIVDEPFVGSENLKDVCEAEGLIYRGWSNATKYAAGEDYDV